MKVGFKQWSPTTGRRDATQDTVLLVSSGKVPLAEGDLEDFEEKLGQVCHGLAEDVVRNGEGTAHVMKVDTYEGDDVGVCFAPLCGTVFVWRGVAWYNIPPETFPRGGFVRLRNKNQKVMSCFSRSSKTISNCGSLDKAGSVHQCRAFGDVIALPPVKIERGSPMVPFRFCWG